MMGYVPETPMDSYQTMPCEDISEKKHNNCNCPNCGAPVNGPICEYCGSILSNEETEQTEYELRRIRKQLAKAKWAWEESVIQAELMQNLCQQSQQVQQAQIKAELDQSIMNHMNYYGYSMSQCCCDTRTQMMQQSVLQSQDYIPKPVPIVIKQKPKQTISEFKKIEMEEVVGLSMVAVTAAVMIWRVISQN